ncbi:hypothetical protein ZWY2020_010978 [Hordeum vulgare]|nr:hypothetical protein ZWY2020_010978 [Hordeum vulgare]
MGGYHGGRPSLPSVAAFVIDLDLAAGPTGPPSDMPHASADAWIDAERPLMARMAARAMDNSIYSKLSTSNFRAGDIRVEGSQDTAVVCMSPVSLFKVFMDDSIYSQASLNTTSLQLSVPPTQASEHDELPIAGLPSLHSWLVNRLVLDDVYVLVHLWGSEVGFREGDAYF